MEMPAHGIREPMLMYIVSLLVQALFGLPEILQMQVVHQESTLPKLILPQELQHPGILRPTPVPIVLHMMVIL